MVAAVAVAVVVGASTASAATTTCADAMRAIAVAPPDEAADDKIAREQLIAMVVNETNEAAACALVAGEIGDLRDSAALAKLGAAKSSVDADAARNARAPIAAGDVQPLATTTTGTQGSVGQVDAVAPLSTCATSGTAAGLAGTPSGSRIVLSGCVNPWGIASADDAESFSHASRLFDLGFSIPIDPAKITNPGAPGAVPFDSIGVRARVDVASFVLEHPFEDAKKRYDDALASVKERWAALASAAQATNDAMRDALLHADDKPACARALTTGDGVGGACGGDGGAGAPLSVEDARDALRDEVERLRRDTGYWSGGVDVRVDYGDVDLGDEDTSATFSFSADLAGSARVVSVGALRVTLRARAGLLYTQTAAATNDVNDVNDVNAEGALGVELAVLRARQSLRITAGVEGRTGKPGAGALPGTGESDAKLGVSIPAADGTDVGLALSLPIGGAQPRTPTFTVSGDWLHLLESPAAAAPAP